MLYKENIALWTPYLYAKPLRYFYSGDKRLLDASVTGVEKNGTMEVVKVACGRRAGRQEVSLHPQPRAGRRRSAGSRLTVNRSRPMRVLYVESVSGDTLSATGEQREDICREQGRWAPCPSSRTASRP